MQTWQTERTASRRASVMSVVVALLTAFALFAWLAWLHLSTFGLVRRDRLETHGGQVWRIVALYADHMNPKTNEVLPRPLSDYLHPDASKVAYEAQLESEYQNGSTVTILVTDRKQLDNFPMYFQRLAREKAERGATKNAIKTP